MHWMAPRKPGSGWSAVNKERIERLIADGLMTPAAWRRSKPPSAMALGKSSIALFPEIPADLNAAFDSYSFARENFEAFPPSARRAILEWISLAKRPETRAKRIEETARLAQDNIRA
ncbi:MAG: YdeI/OmpD-associated family protein [Caldilineaceae bacterium]